MPKQLAIILLNYKHLTDSLSCLKSLSSCKWPLDLKIYFVDNSPEDTDVSRLLKSFPEAIYLPQKQNLGFAKSINIGLKLAKKQGSNYFLIINPDVVVKKDFPKLLNHFKDPKNLLVAPAIQHVQNGKTVFGLDGTVDWKTAKATHRNLKKINNNHLINSEFVTFACVLLNRKTLKRAGFLDERYFMYCEDVDYCLTVKNKGGKIVLDPNICVSHETSSSFAKPTQKLPISFVSQIKFINKWLPPLQRIYPILYHSFLYFYLYLLWSYHYAKKQSRK